MSEIISVMKNVIKLTLRKKSSILVFMLLPIMSIFISKALNTSQKPVINIGVCDEDQSKLSKDLVQYLTKKESFKIFYVDKNSIDENILNEKLNSVIILNKGFEEEIISGNLSKVDMVSIKGAESTIWQENYLNYYISDLLDISKGSNGDKDLFFKVYDDFKNKKISIKNEKIDDITESLDVSKQSIGLLLVFMLTGATISAGTIARDKANRVFKRLSASPLNMWKYIIGNALANYFFNILQIIVILVAFKILKLNPHISMGYMFITLGIFSLVSVALGIFIASVSSSSAQVSQLSNAIIVPTCMLSGCFWPIEFMPKVMQKIALILPQTWTLKIITSLQDGVNFINLIPYIIIILFIAIILFLLAVINLRKNEEQKSYI